MTKQRNFLVLQDETALNDVPVLYFGTNWLYLNPSKKYK